MSQKAKAHQFREAKIAEARERYLEQKKINTEKEAAAYEAELDWFEAKKRYDDAQEAILDNVNELNSTAEAYLDLIGVDYESYVELSNFNIETLLYAARNLERNPLRFEKRDKDE